MRDIRDIIMKLRKKSIGEKYNNEIEREKHPIRSTRVKHKPLIEDKIFL